MANFRAASALGQRFFVTSATITAGCEFAARTISSVSPPCNWISGASGIEGNSSSGDLAATMKEKPLTWALVGHLLSSLSGRLSEVELLSRAFCGSTPELAG